MRSALLTSLPQAPVRSPVLAAVLAALSSAVFVATGVLAGMAGHGSVPGRASRPAPAATAAVGDSTAPEPVERVLVLSLPRLRWADVAGGAPPALVELLERSAVASMSVRTVGPVTTPGDAYATIGAGNRATAPPEVAGLAFPVEADLPTGQAAVAVFERQCGCAADGAAVVHLGAGAIAEENDHRLFGARPGSLGAALAGAGRTAAVVANSDGGVAPGPGDIHREAAVATMDFQGRVLGGAVGSALVVADPSAPGAVRTDVDATVEAFEQAWDTNDVVLIEVGDLERADRGAALAGAGRDATATAAQVRPVAGADELISRVLADVDLTRHLVVVVGPTEPNGPPVDLTVGAVAGPGFEPGLASSGTTRRAGYLSLPDVAPTVLRALGVEIPAEMTGGLMTSAGGPRPDRQLFERLAADSDSAVFRDRATGPVTVAFIGLQLLTYGLAVLLLSGHRPRLRPAVAFLAMTVMAGPTVAFLSGLFPYDGLGLGGYIAAFFASSAALGAGALGVAVACRRWGGPRLGRVGLLVAPLALAGLLLAVLLGDIAFGGALQIDTVFGYSPIVAGRFAGYGNLAFGLVAMSAIVVATGTWGLLQPPGPAGHGRRWPLAVVGGLFTMTVLAIGLPRFGLDVGGVLSAVPAFLVTLLVLAGVKLNWRLVGLVALVTLGTISALALFDLYRPVEARTHLGRFVSLAVESGWPGVSTVIERKITANLRILTSSAWTVVIPAALGFLLFLVWRRPQFLRRLERRMPGSRACLVGALVVAVLSALLNDSGVAIPGLMFAVLLPYLVLLTLTTGDEVSSTRW